MLGSKSCPFVKEYFLGNIYLHANVRCAYIVYIKYQMPTAKALKGIEFLVYALSENMKS